MPRLLAATLLALPSFAGAHELLHAVERGNAIAVRAYEADGDALADAQYEIFSPADPRVAHQRGRTDRNGWLAFVPDAAGRWRVRVIADGGHGLDVTVDAAPPAATSSRNVPSRAAFVLRPLLGLAVIAAVFGVLVAVHRRRHGP